MKKKNIKVTYMDEDKEKEESTVTGFFWEETKNSSLSIVCY